MKKTEYRVGVVLDRVMKRAGDLKRMDAVTMWLTRATDPLDPGTFSNLRDDADIYPPKIAMTWVQVLASRYDCVLVERVGGAL